MNKKNILLLIIFILMLPTLTFSQKKDSLAVISFAGVNLSECEAMASGLTLHSALRECFNRITFITQTTITAMNFQQRIMQDKVSDADSIFELGKILNVSHIMTGYITQVGEQNLILVNIIDIENLQLVAGDYRIYRSIEETDKIIVDITQKLARVLIRDTSRLPGISVPPFNILAGINQNDAQVLEQILIYELANDNKFAVLPRTDSLDKILEGLRGTVNQERIKKLGTGRNVQYVLSGTVQRFGTNSKIFTDVYNITDGSFIERYELQYNDFLQGIEFLPNLVMQLGNLFVEGSFVKIESGSFQMGNANGESNERPVHRVTISTFNLGIYPVTQKEYQEVMGTNPSSFKGENRPVENVSWFNAIEYCNKRSQKEGLTPVYTVNGTYVTWNRDANGYRLPTEAEWEYAVRGGNGSLENFTYSGSNILDEVAWYDKNSSGSTHDVGLKKPNTLGLYDMSGNVWEWCWDWYISYSGTAQTDPTGLPSGGSRRILRGGSWDAQDHFLRYSNRNYTSPAIKNRSIGFRVVHP